MISVRTEGDQRAPHVGTPKKNCKCITTRSRKNSPRSKQRSRRIRSWTNHRCRWSCTRCRPWPRCDSHRRQRLPPKVRKMQREIGLQATQHTSLRLAVSGRPFISQSNHSRRGCRPYLPPPREARWSSRRKNKQVSPPHCS